MANIEIFPRDITRQVAAEPVVQLRNRFAEQNPILNDTPGSLIARPGLRKFIDVGTGPIRALFSESGIFDNDLFVVSGSFLHRVTSGKVVTDIGEINPVASGSPSMATVAPIGDIPARLFIADGGVLWVYTESGQAQGHLEASGNIVNNDVVRIGSIYYQWKNGSVDGGSPDGSSGNPWRVALGTDTAMALSNLYHAINASGEAGVDYTTTLEPHPLAQAFSLTATDLFVNAIDYGMGGNGIVTSTTGANLAWAAGNFQGGGDPSIRQVPVPDDVGAISVAGINSYIIVVPAQDQDINGRFYWVRPGETTIDPLDFATAERSPDAIHQVVVFGDQFWLCGQDTTEVWYMTGDPETPVMRTQGVLFDHGTWEGTAIQVEDSFITVDSNAKVYVISGQQQEISTPDIAERIRKAMQEQAYILGT